MIPELAITTLAAQNGAIHSVVFCRIFRFGSSSKNQRQRCKMVITSDGGYRGNKTIDLKVLLMKP
jgi:acetyl-CoA synthetase